MKNILTLFERQTFTSGASGASKKYVHPLSLAGELGQSDVVRVQVYGHRRDSTAKLTLTAYESSIVDRRPGDSDLQLGESHVVETLRPPAVSFTGPFMGWVEVCFTLEDSAATDVVEFDLEIHATLISAS